MVSIMTLAAIYTTTANSNLNGDKWCNRKKFNCMELLMIVILV